MSHDPVVGGTQIELGPDKHKARVLEGAYSAPDSLPLQVLHEIPGLVAFVGRKDESAKSRVLDAVPIFIQGDTPLTPIRAGIVLLCDQARDFTVENRLAKGNFTLGNVDRLEQHVVDTYGVMTMQYIELEFLNKKLGVHNARFFAKRMTRILRANYPELRKDGRQDASRILLTKPFVVLTKFDPDIKLTSLHAMAMYLGTCWLQAERRLLAKRPEVADRTKYFGDDGIAA